MFMMSQYCRNVIFPQIDLLFSVILINIITDFYVELNNILKDL